MGLSWQQGPLAPGAVGRFLVPGPLPDRMLFAEPLRRRMRVRFGGSWIADSEDVVLLHDGILEPALGITLQAATRETNLTYEREASAAIAAVDSGRAQVSFFLNPVDVEKVMEIATANEVMPQKSTDFYPKLLSGITMYRVES